MKVDKYFYIKLPIRNNNNITSLTTKEIIDLHKIADKKEITIGRFINGLIREAIKQEVKINE